MSGPSVSPVMFICYYFKVERATSGYDISNYPNGYQHDPRVSKALARVKEPASRAARKKADEDGIPLLITRHIHYGLQDALP